MPQKLTKIRGLFTYPSEVTEVPDGALTMAKNCVIERESIIEPRRGVNTYKSISATASDRANNLFTYKNTLLCHFGTTLARDGTDPFTAYSGSYTGPTNGDSYVPKVKGVEANSNFYFITNDGIKKLDALASTPTSAGVPRALDVNLALNGASGFMANNTQVAYRIVWGIKDANQNLILGAPSQRVTVANSSGGTRNVSVNFSVPDGITTSHFYQIYRSPESASSTTEPTDELKLIYEDNPTSGEISAKEVTVIDVRSNDLLGAALYTSPGQEGISASNEVPPQAKDIALFKNHVFYLNTKTKQQLTINLLSVNSATGVSYLSTTGNTNSSTSLTNVVSVTNVVVGMRVTGAGIPANTTVTAITGAGPYTVTISQAATATAAGVTLEFLDVITINGVEYLANNSEDIANRKFAVSTSSSPGTAIEETALSLVKVINRTASNTAIYAYYTSALDELPGKILLQARSFQTAQFSISTLAHGDAFVPSLTAAQSSSNEERKNRLYFSKIQQPESVPVLNYLDIGGAEEPGYRILPLRDILVILKGDGVYRLTGDSVFSFQADILDNTVEIASPETAVILNNQVYALTNQGVATISDTGVGVISRPIESDILDVLNLSNSQSVPFAVAYETSRQYQLWVPTASSDTSAKKAFIYNTFTQAWTTWDKDLNCGIVHPSEDLLYLGSGLSNILRVERKTGQDTDYADEDISVTVSAVTGTTVTLVSAAGIAEGDIIEQSGVPFATILSVDAPNNTIVISPERPFSLAAATVKKFYTCEVEWTSEFFGNAGIMKQVRELKPIFKESKFTQAELSTTSDVIRSEKIMILDGLASSLFGYATFGSGPFGGAQGIDRRRNYVPFEHQRCSWLNTKFKTERAYSRFALSAIHYTYELLSERTDVF